MICKPTDFRSESLIVSYDRTPIPQRAEVLTRVEAERCCVADTPGRSAVKARAVSLRRILDQRESVPSGHGRKSIDVGHLTEEVNRDNGGRVGAYRSLCGLRVDQKRVG
jgi:hypothetical protein